MNNLQSFEDFLAEGSAEELTIGGTAKAMTTLKKDLKGNDVKFSEAGNDITAEDSPKLRFALKQAGKDLFIR